MFAKLSIFDEVLVTATEELQLLRPLLSCAGRKKHAVMPLFTGDLSH